MGGFDTDPHGERHDTRLIKANEKDRFLIPEMSILPMMRICSSYSCACFGTFHSCRNLLFYVVADLVIFSAVILCYKLVHVFRKIHYAYAFHINKTGSAPYCIYI